MTVPLGRRECGSEGIDMETPQGRSSLNWSCGWASAIWRV